MLNFSHQTRVFLCTSAVDMRKSFRGLCASAESLLEGKRSARARLVRCS